MDWLEVCTEVHDVLNNSRRRIASMKRLEFAANPRELVAMKATTKSANSRTAGNDTHTTLTKEAQAPE